MARQVKAYACDYKCGRGVILSKKNMESHESRCFHNPDKRACATCAYFEKGSDNNGMEGRYREEWSYMHCGAIDEGLEKLTSNCELHKLKIPIGKHNG
jgi:hypothetical protein